MHFLFHFEGVGPVALLAFFIYFFHFSEDVLRFLHFIKVIVIGVISVIGVPKRRRLRVLRRSGHLRLFFFFLPYDLGERHLAELLQSESFSVVVPHIFHCEEASQVVHEVEEFFVLLVQVEGEDGDPVVYLEGEGEN